MQWPLHPFVRLAALGAALFWLAAFVEIVSEVTGIERRDKESTPG